MSRKSDNVFSSRRFRLFGVFDIQDLIQWVFSAAASIAIIVLVLICVFLWKEAQGFFPVNHHELETYRQTGQEFVDYIREERDLHREVSGALTRAYYSEVNLSSFNEDDQIKAFGALVRLPATGVPIEHRALVAGLEITPDDTARIAELRANLKEATAQLYKRTSRSDLGFKTRITGQQLAKLKEIALEIQPEMEEEPQYIADLKVAKKEKNDKAKEQYVGLYDLSREFSTAGRELTSLWSSLRREALAIREKANAAYSAPITIEILTKNAEIAEAEGDFEKARAERAKAAAVVVTKVDYDAVTEIFYDSVDEHSAIAANLRESTKEIFTRIPKKSNSTNATENLRSAHRVSKDLIAKLKRNEKKAANWSHAKPYSFIGSVKDFFWGKDWVTNSSWHDFFGVMPLFTGSLLISLIALTVAVPFAVGAAIYVNQLASKREQDVLKPVIEFIEAIPSIVLGFFGIMVLGTFLREMSQMDMFAWIPGFPMSERLNILNAGLLLSFMAIPTIFTLTEDALNNVPQAYSQASLALGASKMQTVLGVVLPSAVSGVVAAILLGFGRIIGETMVVLLVAGNKISMPDFSAGIGVITQPTHTMTGIIAQELGEVDEGSEHWGALFMIGMILFTISLVINYSAQEIIKKFHRA
ncbi:MAG: phosphate ABC transporter permease subunit PstC [Verrucomicrobiota bacterium]